MIKKVLLVISILVFIVSCKEEAPKDYATLSGKIENVKSKEIIIKSRSGYSKKININEDGTFSDTLKLKEKGELFILTVDKPTRVFLKNNDNIKITADANKLNETLKFEGRGSKTNSYIVENSLWAKNLMSSNIFKLKKDEFEKQSKDEIKHFSDLLEKYKKMDSSYYAKQKKALSTLPVEFKQQYDIVNAKKGSISLEGKPSPEFNNYENFKGGTTSLKDLRGNYIYIDVWATWCRPCLGEIPHLQKLEEEFKGKNIHFLSISVDKENKKEAWKKMIADKNMGGIQLFATQGDSFSKDYGVNSIPRFILIDPNGIVVKSKMTRPSDPSTKDFLSKLVK